MHEVELHLGDVSRKCNSRLVEKHSTNAAVSLRQLGTDGREARFRLDLHLLTLSSYSARAECENISTGRPQKLP